jgi:small multidrug resistance pump
MPTSASWIPLALSVVLNAAASLLLKLSTVFDRPAKLLIMGSSIACYGLAFLAYALCLRDLPVSIAYPIITGGAIAVLVLGAAAALGEPLTGSKVLGASLVILGGVLLLRQS